MPKPNGKILRLCLYASAALIVALVVVWAAIRLALNDINRHYEQLAGGMPISEARRLMDGAFVESDTTLAQIEADGFPLAHLLPVEEKESTHAKKYAYRLWKHLYIYVLYDANDRLILKIDAYE